MSKTEKIRDSSAAFILFLFLLVGAVQSTNLQPSLNFYPANEIYVIEGRQSEVIFHLQWNQTDFIVARIFVRVEPPLQARLLGNDSFHVTSEDLKLGINKTLILQGIFLGHAKLSFYWDADGNNESVPTTGPGVMSNASTSILITTPGMPQTIKQSVTAQFRVTPNATLQTNASSDGKTTKDLTDDFDSFWDLEGTTSTSTMKQTTNGSKDSEMSKTKRMDIDEPPTEVKHRRHLRQTGQTRYDRKVQASTETKSLSTDKLESQPGVTNMKVLQTFAHHMERDRTLLSDTYKVHVIRDKGILDTIFMIFIGVFVIINLIMMGCQVEMPIVWSVLKKPVGPMVGFVCQFGFMPLASYAVGQILLTESILQLGLFTLGCSPGGNGSNFYTLLLHGDINLSVTMTFISTISAMFMMPLWMFTLGQKIITKGKITIPFWNLLTSLVTFCIPVAVGVSIRHYRPSWAKTTKKIIRPFTIVIVIAFNVMGYFTSQYMFALMTWQMFLAGMCVSWGGYAFGATIAWLFRMTRPQIIAVSIETAIQNAGIAFMVLGLTLAQPDADLSSVAPVAQLMVTGLPLLIGYALITIYRKLLNCRSEKSMDKPGKLRHDIDIDAIEPLVINRTSLAPMTSAKDNRLSNCEVGNGNSKTNQAPTSNDTIVCANMYNDDDDKVYSKPRVELKLSYDPQQAKYEVPKMKMRTFEDNNEAKEDKQLNHQDTDFPN